MTFKVPVRDMSFTLNHACGFGDVLQCSSLEHVSGDDVDLILNEIGKFCDDVIAPLNHESDTFGAKLEDGHITTAPGFADAHRQYVENGWNTLTFPEEQGGQDLPYALCACLSDAVAASCMSLGLASFLTQGAAKAVAHAATDEQKETYLTRLVTGEWTGAMNLTEPSAGSDLSDMRTRAEPLGDGTYKISGQKIFITFGEHDMTENIVHLVLARLPGAPAGTKGISMFLVPKFLINDDGSLGERNDVHCVGLEEKLGIHASPTCVMDFGPNGNCIGYLLGEENKGLRNMFVMMNSARLDVGLQGVGISERAFQHALAYSLDRRQGRKPGDKDGTAVTIYEHPDIRRMLYSMKALADASRAICYATAIYFDLAKRADDEGVQREAKAFGPLLTPIAKAWSSDRSVEAASMGVQVHGGMGYVEETGAAQFLRDAKIAAIYEGTNGIQALDLVQRKVLPDGGEAAQKFIQMMRSEAEGLQSSNDADMQHLGNRLADSVKALEASTQWVLSAAQSNLEEALGSATPYLKQFGNVVGGYYLCRGAQAARTLGGDGAIDTTYANSKISIATFYANSYLTEAEALTDCVTSSADVLHRLEPEVLTA